MNKYTETVVLAVAWMATPLLAQQWNAELGVSTWLTLLIVGVISGFVGGALYSAWTD